MILVDSSVWIEHMRNSITKQVRFLRSLRGSDILLGDLILLELLQGARSDRHASDLALELSEFKTASLSDPALAVVAARNYRFLRSRGITIRKTVDLIIATFCIESGHELLQSDRDFRPFRDHLGLVLAAA